MTNCVARQASVSKWIECACISFFCYVLWYEWEVEDATVYTLNKGNVIRLLLLHNLMVCILHVSLHECFVFKFIALCSSIFHTKVKQSDNTVLFLLHSVNWFSNPFFSSGKVVRSTHLGVCKRPCQVWAAWWRTIGIYDHKSRYTSVFLLPCGSLSHQWNEQRWEKYLIRSHKSHHSCPTATSLTDHYTQDFVQDPLWNTWSHQ